MGFGTILHRLQELGAAFLELLPGLLVGVLTFALFALLARGVRNALARGRRLRARSPGLAVVVGRIASWLVILLGLLVAAAIAFPSINAADLFGVLGVGSVAIGFAFRDILQNLLAGILILLTRPFRLGDQIQLGEFEGTVEDIKVRATILRTYDNRRAVIPNADLFTGKVLVHTAYDRRRLSVRVGIGYGDDIALAKRVVTRALHGATGVLDDPPPFALVTALGDSAVLLDVYFWIDPPRRAEALEVADRVLERIKPALQHAGIDLPFPTTQILFHDQTESTDGDRARQREGWPSRGHDPGPRADRKGKPVD